MPTKREIEYMMDFEGDPFMDGYRAGFRDGVRSGTATPRRKLQPRRTKRKLSAWNKFVKANAKKPRFRYRNGKLNLKKMAIAFRKTPAGRKKRR